MENTINFKALSNEQLESVVGGKASRNYYNGRGTGRNIKAATTIASLIAAGAALLA